MLPSPIVPWLHLFACRRRSPAASPLHWRECFRARERTHGTFSHRFRSWMPRRSVASRASSSFGRRQPARILPRLD